MHNCFWPFRRVVFLVLLSAFMVPCSQYARAQDEVGIDALTLPDDMVDLPLIGDVDSLGTDYLINATQFVARVGRSEDCRELILDNGLVRRTWRLAPNCACVGYDDLMTGQTMLRSVRPEARITIDGGAYDVGGLTGQPDHAFLTPAWLDAMQADPKAMRFVGFEIGEPAERFAWGRRRHAAPNATWPPKGVYLVMNYAMPPVAVTGGSLPSATRKPDASEVESVQAPVQAVDELAIRVRVHYEMYDGLPLMSKWITVHNDTEDEIIIDRFVGEELALVEHTSRVEFRDGVAFPRPDYLHVETDFAFGGMTPDNANRHVVHWRTDPQYDTQVNYARQTPCLLVCEPTYGPSQRITSGEVFESFRVFELTYDRGDRERRSLALRRMYRTVSPWVTENPLTHHLLSHNADRVREAIDEAKVVGFEAIILSFGSGFNMENQDAAFLARWQEVASYAQQQGIELGSYSLFSSRGVGGDNMIVSPPGQRITHDRCPAVTSPWGQQWLTTIRDFYDTTGFDQFENDGPYPGDIDVTVRPPFQRGADDSRWVQWRMTAKLYRDLRARGIYINAPDYYYLSGSNKCSMGYREVNWSLPRAQQVIHTRQNIHDGSWSKTPSMGWMHVPLSQYHGGGPAATIEPLHEHLDHYQRIMRSNLGMGVQAHYRGPRLFDTDETRAMVKGVVDWFRAYRDILESDLIHGRRADGRDLDWVLHVNPQLDDKGMLCVYNPLDHDVTKTLQVNLYYTGLTDTARISAGGDDVVDFELARDYTIEIEVTVPAGGMSWYVIR